MFGLVRKKNYKVMEENSDFYQEKIEYIEKAHKKYTKMIEDKVKIYEEFDPSQRVERINFLEIQIKEAHEKLKPYEAVEEKEEANKKEIEDFVGEKEDPIPKFKRGDIVQHLCKFEDGMDAIYSKHLIPMKIRDFFLLPYAEKGDIIIYNGEKHKVYNRFFDSFDIETRDKRTLRMNFKRIKCITKEKKHMYICDAIDSKKTYNYYDDDIELVEKTSAIKKEDPKRVKIIIPENTPLGRVAKDLEPSDPIEIRFGQDTRPSGRAYDDRIWPAEKTAPTTEKNNGMLCTNCGNTPPLWISPGSCDKCRREET